MNYLIYMCVLIIFFIIIMISNQFKKVKENEVYIIERNKKFKRLATSGIIFVIPFIEKIRYIVELSNQTQEGYQNIGLSLDNQVVRCKLTFDFHVIDAYKAAYEVPNLELQLMHIENNLFREIIR